MNVILTGKIPHAPYVKDGKLYCHKCGEEMLHMYAPDRFVCPECASNIQNKKLNKLSFLNWELLTQGEQDFLLKHLGVGNVTIYG